GSGNRKSLPFTIRLFNKRRDDKKTYMKQIIFVHLLNDYSGSPKVLSQVINVVEKVNGSPILYVGKGSSGFLSNSTEKLHGYYYRRFNNRFATLFSFLYAQVLLFVKLLKYWNKDVVIYVNTMLP